jgi:hypothetical protein
MEHVSVVERQDGWSWRARFSDATYHFYDATSNVHSETNIHKNHPF